MHPLRLQQHDWKVNKMATWITVINDTEERYTHCVLGPFDTEVDAAMAGAEFTTFMKNEGPSDTMDFTALPLATLEDARDQERRFNTEIVGEDVEDEIDTQIHQDLKNGHI